ncbi:Phenylpropionate dioxygenase, large terminal subunit [Pseudonocardia thermophila]|jgi:Phenylpropionate dioxygenase and related ring-hydroxylating dioxygenases, large terminal subunit|uniref:Phenylpropionate dioxygenase, large terminal subunit n=1 Tax=Pseudonocardia thermophila TaxID=1848 RepID=A0A1M6Y1V6_PSETH|nr:aromatic ring-hydroxylating dioxygenase subunit alpha [Pseudonocardia thermophila]SHL12089.1 Phenylpropionate dioxygenase, large terminal subunit [Pseudonocardia thermophila]
MTAPALDREAYRRLIEDDRVHGSLYTDPAVFDDELTRIWYRTWVYVGHESEIPQPGDYVVKSIGPQSIIMSRDRQGAVHLLLNRCSHRGNQICEAARGNTGALRCHYHGWTFGTDGALLGYPFRQGYGPDTPKSALGLGRVPRMGSYQGFVFGSFAHAGPSLLEHLGAAREAIDRLVRLSPLGRVELTAGWLHHEVRANWKMLVENETDGYHPQFVHSSIFEVGESHVAEVYSERSAATARDLGGGHTEHDLRAHFRRMDRPLAWFGTTEDRLPDYCRAMREAYGAEKAREILVEGSPHIMVFPNLFIAEIQIFVIQPLAVDRTVQHVTPLQLAGAPDMNRRLLHQASGSVGPAGFLLADDSEMYERNQRGVVAREPEWLILRRGLNRERVDADGHLAGAATDETTQRGIWRHIRAMLTEEVPA